ncbi:MAG: calcium/sodium antiporter [Oscillospiraceae bacterium]|nr:calcium/sodium antiporter [Oscillospiraceae bacterium]
MPMVITIVLLLVGFVLLVKGSDAFVDGSSSVAKLLGVPGVIVGLTIVSMGTSAPEAAVSVTAGFNGSNEIAISNLVGSNAFNMLIVAGLSAAITPFMIDKIVLKRDFPVCLGIMAVTILMCLDGVVSRLDGIIMLVIFVAYISYLIYDAVKNRGSADENDDEKPMSTVKSIIFIIVGLAAVIAGGQCVVSSAQKIALALGMSETIVGLTVVAIGTSLPELVTSVVAARKGHSDIAIGNVVGSSIFNLAFVMGMSSTANPIGVVPEAIIDAFIMLGVNALGFVFCITRRKFERWEGITLVCIYAAYTAYLLMR